MGKTNPIFRVGAIFLVNLGVIVTLGGLGCFQEESNKDKTPPPKAYIHNYTTNAQIYNMSYGSTTWSEYLYPDEYTEEKTIPNTINYFYFRASNGSYYVSCYINFSLYASDPPEDGNIYELCLSGSVSSGTGISCSQLYFDLYED